MNTKVFFNLQKKRRGKWLKKKQKLKKKKQLKKFELKKVKWPSKKEVLKYTFATIMFVLVLVGFFILMSLLMSVIRGAFN